MEKKNKIGKIVGAVGACVVLLGAGIGTGFALDKEVDIPALKAAAFTEGAASITPEIEIKTVTEIVYEDREVEVEVFVDNENLGLVLDHIYDNEGRINYLLDDLDDDDVDQIVDRIIFINEIKGLAVAEVENEFKDLMDKEDFKDGNNTVFVKFFDEDDIERVRVQGDSDEVKVIDPDFEDGDADVTMFVKFEQDDVKYIAEVNVEFKDGEVDDLDLIDVELYIR